MRRISCLLMAILCLFLLGSCGETSQPPDDGGPTQPGTPASSAEPAPPAGEQTDSPSEEPVSIYQFLIDGALRADNFDDSITYDDLSRSPDEMEGTYVQLAGKIVQIMEGDGFTAYRFAVDNDYDKMIYVESYPEYPTGTLIEDDYATLSGVAYGVYSYESVLGSTITLPAVLAAKFEKAELALPDYPAGPLTLEKSYSSGRVYSTTEIESFSIIDAEIGYSGDLHITCQVTGTVSGSSYLSLDLKCYDKDDILIKTAGIIASVSDGERFRISDDAYIPMDTVRIELAAD